MTADDRAQRYPDVRPDQFEVIDRWRDFIGNTGGNEPEDLLQRIQGREGKHLAQTNIIVFVMAQDVAGQVRLLRALEEAGKLSKLRQPAQEAEIRATAVDAKRAAHGDSNDEEIEALQLALDTALEALGFDVAELEAAADEEEE